LILKRDLEVIIKNSSSLPSSPVLSLLVPVSIVSTDDTIPSSGYHSCSVISNFFLNEVSNPCYLDFVSELSSFRFIEYSTFLNSIPLSVTNDDENKFLTTISILRYAAAVSSTASVQVKTEFLSFVEEIQKKGSGGSKEFD
jgi:hypothetical protein